MTQPSLTKDILDNTIRMVVTLILFLVLPPTLGFLEKDLLGNIILIGILFFLSFSLLRSIQEWLSIYAYYSSTKKGYPYLRGQKKCPFLAVSGFTFQCKADIIKTNDPDPITKCHNEEEFAICMKSKGPRILEAMELEPNTRRKQQYILYLRIMDYKEAAPKLLELLDTESEENAVIKETIAFTLGYLGSEQELEGIIRHIGKHTPAFDNYAIKTITLLGTKAIPHLKNMIINSIEFSESISITAVKELAIMTKEHPEEVLEVTKELLESETLDSIIKSYLLDSIEQTKDKDLIEELVTPFLENEDIILRQTAQQILDSYNTEEIEIES